MAAVHDGYLLQKSVVSVPLAGRTLARCMAGSVAAKGSQIRPRFEFRRKEGAGGSMEVRPVAHKQAGRGVCGACCGAGLCSFLPPTAVPLLLSPPLTTSPQVVPLDTPGVTDSYRRWAVEGIAGEMKDAICR